MYITQILSQHRRDFSATIKCEHCGHEQKLTTGYDDRNYHDNVVPALICESCRKVADGSVAPMGTKYAEAMTI